jgi:hypothetical protein
MPGHDVVLLEADGVALERQSAPAVLAWALARFHPRIALASSFGAEDVVLIDMLMTLDPRARVFTLDTGRATGRDVHLDGGHPGALRPRHRGGPDRGAAETARPHRMRR